MTIEKKLKEAQLILLALGLPRAQLNERTALCLLCLLNLKPDKQWKDAESPLIGITPIIDWSKQYYNKPYAPNTREAFRRQSMHQFIQAGICLYNPDKKDRPVNSPHAVYQIEPNLLEVLKKYEELEYESLLAEYLLKRKTLIEQYAGARMMQLIPVKLTNGTEIKLSVGKHSELIKNIITNFATRYSPNGELVYVGDTGNKFAYFNIEYLESLGVKLNNHGKLPDVIIHYTEKNWLLLIESVTSHGPVDSKRHQELEKIFSNCTAGLVYVSAFPNRKIFLKYLQHIAWETEVWIADAPSHMIHFNGCRFLGPYDKNKSD
jgi:BsuBI/PstI restriction endonuclease domain/BsuBI/PstI restriction endonuclease HTH domain